MLQNTCLVCLPSNSSQALVIRMMLQNMCLLCLMSILIHPHTVRMMLQNMCLVCLPSISSAVLAVRIMLQNMCLVCLPSISSHPQSHVWSVFHLSRHTHNLIRLTYGQNYVAEYVPDLPTIYLITPTHTRLEQKADLVRLSYTLLHIYNIHWIVIEDSDFKTPLVTNFLSTCGLNYTHLNVKTPPEVQCEWVNCL